MIRKVIQQGPSTLMISLPSKWVKQNSIKKGNEINLEIENNQLKIYSKTTKNEKIAEIRMNSKEEYLDRIIMSKYRSGFNKLIVYYDDPSVITNIKKTLEYLLGFEIVDQNKNSCVIQNVSEGTDENFPKMFRRMFQIMVSMGECCFDYICTEDKKNLETAIDLRETLIKLEQFNLRIINKKNSFSLDKKSLEYLYVWHICSFGKAWASLAKKILPNLKQITEEEKRFFKGIINYQRYFYETYYSREIENLTEMKRILYELRPIGAKLFEESENKMMIYYLLRLINRMYEITQSFEIEN